MKAAYPSSPNPESLIPQSAARAGAFQAGVPLVQAATAQCGAFLATLSLLYLYPSPAPGAGDVLALAVLQGGVAAVLGRVLGMESWWIPIHALFVPGLVGLLQLRLPPVWFLAGFAVLASVYWSVARTRVPLFLSSRAAARAVAELLPRERSFMFIDLGSGLGGMLCNLARARPAGSFHGIESAPLPFLLSTLRTALSVPSGKVGWGHFQDLDLGHYDVVYAYLSPAAMPGLWVKARREMRPGTLLISNAFAIPGVAPTCIVPTERHGGAALLLWRM